MEKSNLRGRIRLYLQLKEKIVQELLKGNFLRKGNCLPSFQEIAQKYEVSVMTVNLAMEELKKDKIIYTTPSRGTYLKKDLKQIKSIYLSRKKSLTFGLTFLNIYNLSSSLLSEVVKGVSEKSRQLNINLQIFSIPAEEMDPEGNPFLWENLRKRNLDGLILASRMPLKDIVFLQETKIPFVWINDRIPGEKMYCTLSDKFQTALLILEHIYLLGHRKISLIVPNDSPSSISYMRGLSKEKKIVLKENLIKTNSGDEREVGYQATKEILIHQPDVIIGSGIETIYGIISALEEKNFSFPKDIALIGIGADKSEALLSHNITVVEIPVREMASTAAEMLYKILIKEETEEEIIFPPKLHIRGSCGFPMEDRKEIIVCDLEELREVHIKLPAYQRRVLQPAQRADC